VQDGHDKEVPTEDALAIWPNLIIRAEAYRDEANASVVTEAIHLTLFFTIQQVVMVLHADKLRPAVPLGSELHLRELHCPH